MTEFITAQEASERFDEVTREIEEKVYEVSDNTRSILTWAIEGAMNKWERDVSITSRWYRIDEGWWLVKSFLEQQGYQNVIIEEKWYSCFDNNRWYTQIIFSF
jgi:hypothetical protein